MSINELLPKVTKEQLLNSKSDLLVLFESEIFAKNLYFQELRKFEGEIFETIKWLSEQEDRHAEVMRMLLSRAGLPFDDSSPKLPNLRVEEKAVLKIDVEAEEKAMAQYASAIKSSSGALKQIFQHLYEEELIHIARLKKYLAK